MTNQGVPDTPYTRIDAIVGKYVEAFEIDDGAGSEYVPTYHERYLIETAIHGLICREDFMETILLARALTHKARKAECQHACCGAGLEHPHYGLCVNAELNR